MRDSVGKKKAASEMESSLFKGFVRLFIDDNLLSKIYILSFNVHHIDSIA